MEHLTITNVILAICGLLVHEILRFKNRKNRTPFVFGFWFSRNIVSVILSLVSTFAILLMLPDITSFLGIKSEDGSNFESITAFLAGYSNQSIIKNIIGLFRKKEA